jgi:5-deoxy-5-amino-3-dehydroquinate synthase
VNRVPVALARAPYDVIVGLHALDEVADLVAGRRAVGVVTQDGIPPEYAEHVSRALGARGILVEQFRIGDGEATKSLATVEALTREFAASGLLRGDAVVAVGGGVVGDTTGFAAAVFHRGIDVVQVPTTLLAQVDAAIGGKTAVNLPEGKNLVGAFHQPLGVVADTGTLATLPPREYASGLGEVAKYALIEESLTGETTVVDLLRISLDDVLARNPEVLAELVTACAGIKAHVVAADEEERSGVRATLNYGHTLAHALETNAGYDLLHGEAVAIGLAFAGHLAGALERIGPAEVDRHLRLVMSLGLPSAVPGGDDIDPDELIAAMRRDKKASGGLTFVLRGPNGIERVDDPAPTAVAAALGAVGVGG